MHQYTDTAFCILLSNSEFEGSPMTVEVITVEVIDIVVAGILVSWRHPALSRCFSRSGMGWLLTGGRI